MPAKIPAHIREQQINALPNIEFVRWLAPYKNNTSKAIVRCAIDGGEWSASVANLINKGSGCPKCGIRCNSDKQRIPADARAKQINALPNINFVRWDGAYKNAQSKAMCRCAIDGFEWVAGISSLLDQGTGCPQCSGKRRWTAEERIAQINAKPNINFVRWEGCGYVNSNSKAICRCEIDGYEWASAVDNLINGKGSGCPQCAGRRSWSAEDREEQINALSNIEFVRWDGTYKNAHSKAICRCAIDGHEWSISVNNLRNGRGCPKCSKHGFNRAKNGALYILRSECGAMVKIGISNNYEQRHAILKRKTPFDWSCIEILHGDGATIAEWEKEFHSWTEQVGFKDQFDGSTEWRKWDDRLPQWIKRHRARLERYNKAP